VENAPGKVLPLPTESPLPPAVLRRLRRKKRKNLLHQKKKKSDKPVAGEGGSDTCPGKESRPHRGCGAFEGDETTAEGDFTLSGKCRGKEEVALEIKRKNEIEKKEDT